MFFIIKEQKIVHNKVVENQERHLTDKFCFLFTNSYLKYLKFILYKKSITPPQF